MAIRKLTLGFHVSHKTLQYASMLRREESIRRLLDTETAPTNRLLFTLSDYLIKFTKKFDKYGTYLDANFPLTLPNNTIIMGVLGAINQSKVDISNKLYKVKENDTRYSDIAYPYKLRSFTFSTQKPENEPQVFGILRTFSVAVWIAMILVLVVMPLIYHFTLKKRDSLDTILIHVFAVLFRQSSILNPSSMAERLLVYAWVIGAMFLCLAYESVFFSFLAIPPVTRIKDMSQLARAVEKGEYHCFGHISIFPLRNLSHSEQKKFKVMQEDFNTNKLAYDYDNVEQNFILRKPNTRKLALITTREEADRINVGQLYTSDDHFFETMFAMRIRKGFCCKKLIESFVHKMMASGLYFKYRSDFAFKYQVKLLPKLKDLQQDSRLLLKEN